MDEWQMVRDALKQHGVASGYFPPSQLDERAAFPVLLQLLPALTDPRLVGAIAAHLRRPWARPAAFEPLRQAFEHWAPRDPLGAGWALGDALATAAGIGDLPALLPLAADTRYGSARQMIVDALWRCRRSPQTEPALAALIRDPDVALHAMSALRRAIGASAALPYRTAAAADHREDPVGPIAARQIRQAEAALRKQPR